MRIYTSPYLELRWDLRWPAFAIGFMGNGRTSPRTFIFLIAPLTIEIGRRV